jgi:hypothetical protein
MGAPVTLFKILIMTGVLIGLTPLAQAQEPQGPTPLLFQAWKDQQVLEAQNQVLRISARIATLKSSKPVSSKKESKEVANGKLKRVSDSETLSAAEQDLKRAQESLSTANNLQFEDYVDVYIPTLADQPEALQKLSDKLSKDELSQIFKGLMAKNAASSGDAKRNAAIADGLGGTARAKNP